MYLTSSRHTEVGVGAVGRSDRARNASRERILAHKHQVVNSWLLSESDFGMLGAANHIRETGLSCSATLILNGH